MSIESKNWYFASDFHFGAPSEQSSRERERRVVAWLDSIQQDCSALFLLGDLFDFWFEYHTVAPKGYVRFLAKVASFTDAGIPVHVFTGNHDLWMWGYLEKECGVKIYMQPLELNSPWAHQLYLAHGDGLGPGDKGYKLLKKVFTNRVLQVLFRWVHPDIGYRVANYFSRSSRKHTNDAQYLGEDKEWLILHSKELIKSKPYHYMIYGHRHLPMVLPLGEQSSYVNLGDWMSHNTYAKLGPNGLELLKYSAS